jgi:hypothetical protein
MPPEYLELARKRVEMCWPGYQQPEEFRYNFRDWVSPYTNGAHALGGIAASPQACRGVMSSAQRKNSRGTNWRL